jgi:hypothetical protein
MQRRAFIQAFAGAMAAALSPAVTVTRAFAQTAPALPSQATLDAVADTLIPKTDTPGAADTGVTAWILGTAWPQMLRPAERQLLATGLLALDEAATETLGMGFAKLPAERRTHILATIDVWALDPAPPKGEDAALQRALRGFWFTLKRLVIAGHYTSEVGCKAELDYRPVPGPFQGDLPMTAQSRTYYQDWIGVPFFPGAPVGGA